MHVYPGDFHFHWISEEALCSSVKEDKLRHWIDLYTTQLFNSEVYILEQFNFWMSMFLYEKGYKE